MKRTLVAFLAKAILLIFSTIPVFTQTTNLDSLWQEYNEAKHDTTRILLLIDEIGYKYQNIDPDSAILFYKKAVSIADKALRTSDDLPHKSFSSLKSASLRYIGIVYQIQGNNSSALEYFFKSLDLAKKNNDKRELSRCYNNLGIIHRRQGDLEQAIRYYLLSLKISEEMADKLGMSYAYNNIGVVYRGKGDYSIALDYFLKSLSIREELDDRKGMSLLYNNIGNIYRTLGDFNKAISYYNKSLAIEEELEDRIGMAMIYGTLARMEISLADSTGVSLSENKRNNHLRKAIEFGEKSYEYAGSIGSLRRQNAASKHLMYAYKELGHHQKSLKYAMKFIATNDNMFNEDKTRAIAEMQTKYESERKQEEIAKQQLIIEKQEIDSIRQKNQRNFLIVIFLLSVATIVIVLINYLNKQKANRILTERAYEIETLNEELITTNEELHAQRDNLEKALINLQNTQKKLVQSEKMASLGLLASGVAHEINNPLNFIQGAITELENNLKSGVNQDDEENITLIGMVHSGVKRVSGIVSGLNHYSRKDDFISMDCNIHSIIDNCLLMLNKQIKNRIEVKKEYTKKRFSLNCNEGKLHQALLNILSNAVDAIEKKGSITVKTSLAEDKLILSIEDTGCGIPEVIISKVTDPFFTTKEPGKGTGLGLSITQNIIAEHNGSIDFLSELKKGSKVSISIPIISS